MVVEVEEERFHIVDYYFDKGHEHCHLEAGVLVGHIGLFSRLRLAAEAVKEDRCLVVMGQIANCSSVLEVEEVVQAEAAEQVADVGGHSVVASILQEALWQRHLSKLPENPIYLTSEMQHQHAILLQPQVDLHPRTLPTPPSMDDISCLADQHVDQASPSFRLKASHTPRAVLVDSCEESIMRSETYRLRLEILPAGCLKGGGEEPMRHARKLS